MYLVEIVFLLSCLTCIMSQNCPPEEDIYPCSCLGSANNLHAHCAGLATLDQLRISVRGFSSSRIQTFTISGSTLEYLPNDIFQNVSIHHLSISKSNMSRIGNMGVPQFQGLESSLESLTISETFTEKQPFTYVFMDHLKNLKSLELRKNFVEVVHNEWFKSGPANLEVVRFVQGQIRRVGYRALQNLLKLRVVDLSDNVIDYLGRTALPEPASYMEEINLERNKLESLPDDIFSQMPNLKKVNLELNQFSTIDQKAWKPVWSHLENLNIDYNPLICDAKIKWMYEDGKSLENKVVASCYKPFKLMDRELHTLELDELK